MASSDLHETKIFIMAHSGLIRARRLLVKKEHLDVFNQVKIFGLFRMQDSSCTPQLSAIHLDLSPSGFCFLEADKHQVNNCFFFLQQYLFSRQQ